MTRRLKDGRLIIRRVNDGRVSAGVILGQFCIWISDAALDDLFFFSKICFIKSSVNIL